MGEVEKMPQYKLICDLSLTIKIQFLTTRVKEPDVDDWKKLKRVLLFLNGTLEDKLTLSADNTNVLKWWADGAFAVLPDFRSQTGGTMTMGQGSIWSSSAKQKLNSNSSTETELIAAHDIMTPLMWTKHFLESQGYQIDKSLLHQDNKAAMLLENNGRASSGKRTRHINTRYFFITDKTKNGDVDVACCPSDEMRADYFTKPLNGKKFNEFRKLIMNLKK